MSGERRPIVRALIFRHSPMGCAASLRIRTQYAGNIDVRFINRTCRYRISKTAHFPSICCCFKRLNRGLSASTRRAPHSRADGGVFDLILLDVNNLFIARVPSDRIEYYTSTIDWDLDTHTHTRKLTHVVQSNRLTRNIILVLVFPTVLFVSAFFTFFSSALPSHSSSLC